MAAAANGSGAPQPAPAPSLSFLDTVKAAVAAEPARTKMVKRNHSQRQHGLTAKALRVRCSTVQPGALNRRGLAGRSVECSLLHRNLLTAAVP